MIEISPVEIAFPPGDAHWQHPRRSSVTLSRRLAGIFGMAVLFSLLAPLGAAATVQRTVFVEEFGYVS